MRNWLFHLANNLYEDASTEYLDSNLIKEHHVLFLRHAGNLVFDVIHFCEFQKQVYLSRTTPLPSILQQQGLRYLKFSFINHHTIYIYNYIYIYI